ncbi:MAG: hypothetical protein KDM91_02405 [Verrucomicrobiae bacterium]|nr:hypothetical protein [Verrucomicrobiae bacterium]MCB1233905.1 hypothetical protein [Verrucomicrobiae bacterium]
MNQDEIDSALEGIERETDSNVRAVLTAALVSELFREEGFEPVVVGGSAIEVYTEGAYRSGDVDLCFSGPSRPDLETRAQIMRNRLHAKGSLRTWQIGGQFIDLLGELETVSHKSLRSLETPLGEIVLMPVEELIAERVFVARGWQSPNEDAEICARKLINWALQQPVSVDWDEVERIAKLPVYDCADHLAAIKSEVEAQIGKE